MQHTKGNAGDKALVGEGEYVHANQPSSSSLRVGAGNGAPGLVSAVGNLT